MDQMNDQVLKVMNDLKFVKQDRVLQKNMDQIKNHIELMVKFEENKL